MTTLLSKKRNDARKQDEALQYLWDKRRCEKPQLVSRMLQYETQHFRSLRNLSSFDKKESSEYCSVSSDGGPAPTEAYRIGGRP
jgi:hypothetical protein